MKEIAIIGAGGFGREVKMLIEQINSAKLQYRFIGYFDDGFGKDTLINGMPVLGTVADLKNWKSEIAVVLAIGNPGTKEGILEKISNSHITFPVLIHPNVLIGDMTYNTIGHGTIICAGVIITVNTQIGKHVIFNLACTVGHDTVIGDYCSFMPGVNISGEVNIGKGVYVGTGAKIINQLSIGESTIVGAGAVVSKSLPSHCTAVGVPARPINK